MTRILLISPWVLFFGTTPIGCGEGWLAGQVSHILMSATSLLFTRNRPLADERTPNILEAPIAANVTV